MLNNTPIWGSGGRSPSKRRPREDQGGSQEKGAARHFVFANFYWFLSIRIALGGVWIYGFYRSDCKSDAEEGRKIYQKVTKTQRFFEDLATVRGVV